MFIDELQPIFQEFLQHPLAFTGGFISGSLKLELSEDPLKTWLKKQGLTDFTHADSTSVIGSGPQSISID
ncbi:MAG: hypothetical protein KPI85_00755 [cyanobacterium endosymbiont of Epithemia adnata isolate EadnSB Bon19]|uniref:hypothetical protein n=1 Tax=cyanobacterium endosymbiont of Epithemia turgida TaxID=718217 RepID=UPI0004D1EFEA|nr:hypothetical protein [cyanobacterium endosymbiont of Epithemia turgida]BAP17969.1 hypothetical protein ETSB_1205 [cyanobacterium endosymbiont of Epithemia turgida isolate EtSB Lake Yunoko]